MNAARRRPAATAAALAVAALALAACVPGGGPDADGAGSGAAENPPTAEGESSDAEADAGEGGAADLGARLHPDLEGRPTTEVVVESAGEQYRVQAVVAASPAQRQRGLQHVEEVPEGTGMLFLHREPTDGGYWMRDTLVPLEIAYADADGEIVGVRSMEPCRQADCPTYAPGTSYRVALEVPDGWLSDRDVGAGDRLRWGPVPEPR